MFLSSCCDVEAEPPQITGPRLLHGSLAAITDIWVGELALRVIGKRYAPVAVGLKDRLENFPLTNALDISDVSLFDVLLPCAGSLAVVLKLAGNVADDIGGLSLSLGPQCP